MKSKKVRNSGGGNASAASGSRDRSSGISGNRFGGPKDSGNLRHSSNRPMSSSPSRMSGEIHNQHRGPGYQQHGGAEGHSASSGNAGVADGVYSNKRLMHACTCLIGTTVQVETIDGNVHEGLFRTFSPDLEITLEQAHQVDPKNPTTITAEVVKEIMIFEMKEVLHMSAIGVDLDYAAKEGFQTDMQISSKNNGDGDRYRVLKEFEFDDYSMSDDRLEGSFSIDDHTLEEGSNGWSADDMFRMNEKKYGVQTSYKENMEGYTVQLKEQDKSSDEYRDREARAAKLAREIEGTTSSHLAAELENGDDDEENAFSAVVRDPNQRNDREGKYITPARRQHSTSSNSGGAGGKQHMNAGRNQAKGTPPPGVGHNQAHPGGNLSNRSDRGGGSQHRGSIGNASGAYGHNQGASANATGSAGRDQSSSQDDYGPRGASTGSGRQEFKQDLRPRLNYAPNTPQSTQGSSGQSNLYRQTSQGGGEKNRVSDAKTRDTISDLKDFKEKFVLGDSGPASLPSSNSDRSSYNQPPYHGPPATIVSVSANPTSNRDPNKQSSPKQHSGSSVHGTHHSHPYSQHGPEQHGPGNRIHSRSPPTPSSSSKGSSPPSLASIGTDAPPSQQNSKRFSPSQSTGNNSTVPVASVGGKQSIDANNARSDARTPPTPTVAVSSLPPDVSNLSISSGQNAPSTSESPSTLPSTPISAASNVATKSKLNPNAKEFVLNPTAKAFVPAAALPTVTPSVHRPPTALTPQQTHPQRSLTPGQSVGGTGHQPVAVQYNTHPAPHFQVHPQTGANFSPVSGAQGNPSVATVQQSHPQMQGQLIQYIHNPAAYAAQAASSHLAAQAVVQQVQGTQIPGQNPISAQGSGVPPTYGTPQHYGIPGGSSTVGPPPHNPSAQQQQVPLQVRYPRSAPGNGNQGVSQTPPAIQQSNQGNQQRGQGQGANDGASPSVLAATGQPLLAPPNSQAPGGIQDSQQPNMSALGYQMFNPQMAAAQLIQATNPAGAPSVMMRLPNGAVMPIASSMAQMSANNALQQAAQQAQASATSGIPPPQPGHPQQSSDQTQQNTGPGSLPPPGGMSLPSPGGNVVTWVPQPHGAQPPSVIPGPPPPTSGIGAPPSHPSGQPHQNQQPPPSSGGPPIPPPGQQQSGGQITPAPSPGPGIMYSVQPPSGMAQAQGAPAHHGQGNTQSLHFATNYPSGPGVYVLPPNHASAGMHAIHHQTVMSQAGSVPVQSANGQAITSMAGVMPPPIHHYMQHQPNVQGVPGQHNPPPSMLYPVNAHAMNAAAVQHQQAAAAAAAAQQQQNTQPPTPGAQ